MGIHEESMIFPDIFDGHAMGFFTTKTMGAFIEDITGRHSFRRCLIDRIPRSRWAVLWDSTRGDRIHPSHCRPEVKARQL